MARLTIQPEYRALVESNGLADFDALFAAGERQRVDGHHLRSVSRLELRDGQGRSVVIYLKRWWGERAGPAWGDLLHLRWPKTAACREWSSAMRLLRAGIAVAPPVAWGRSDDPGGPRALVAFREVAGPSLASLLHDVQVGKRQPSPRLRRTVAEAVGKAMRRLHGAGFSMPDLYAKHVFLENIESGRPQVVLIDVQRVGRLSAWRAAADLGALYASTLGSVVRPTDRLRLLRAYLGLRRLDSGARRFIDRIEWFAGRMRGRGKDPNLMVSRQTAPAGVVPLAEEKMTVVDGGRLHINEAFRPLLEAAGLMDLDRLMALEGGESCREAPGRSTVRLELPAPAGGRRACYLKRYTAAPLLKRLRRMLSVNPPISMASGEARGIARLASIGIASMRVVAFGEAFSWRGWSERSCLVTEEVAGATQADDYCQAHFAPPAPPEAIAARRRLVRSIAGLARRLRQADLSHRDFYLCHILVRPVERAEPVLHLIDLQRLTRHGRGIGERWVVKDLAALLFSSWPSPATGIRSEVFTDSDCLRFACAYFGVRRLTAEHKRMLRHVVAKARAIACHEQRRRARQEGGA
jgi:hypothetical protein